MRILVVGASGTIGSAVFRALSARHEVLEASRSGDVRVDLSDQQSIVAMYETVPQLDAVVSAAGTGKFGPLDQLTDDDFDFGLNNKLMGQINLVRYGQTYLNDNGSFTLNSGILAHRPNSASVLISILNAGIETFVQAAASAMPRGQRLNGICPPMVKETAEKMGWGEGGTPADEVARYYVQSVESTLTGRILGPLHANE